MVKKPKKFFSLKYRLFLLTACISVVVISIVCGVTIQLSSGYVRQEMTRSFGDQTQQLNNVIDFFIATLKNQALSVAVNGDVVSFMNGVKNDQKGYTTIKNVSKLVQTQKFNFPYTDVYLFNILDKHLVSSDTANNTTNYGGTGLEKADWYRDMLESGTDLLLLNNFRAPYGGGEPSFAVALKYVSYPQNQLQGFIVFSVGRDFMGSMMAQTSFTQSEFFDVLIADDTGAVVYQSGKTDFSKEIPGFSPKELLDTYTSGKRVYHGLMVEVNHSKHTGWNVICVHNQEQFYFQLRRINWMIVGMTAIGVLVLLGCLIVICNKFINPLIRLRQLMKEAEQTNYSVRAEVRGRDEVTELSACFNEMLQSVLENQVLRKEAEIYALQQQINPHFLYNTLGAVKSLARLNRTGDVRLIVDNLSAMFRYSVNMGKNKQVALKDEIAHVNSYFAIMELRYDHAFRWEIQVEEELLSQRVPCFILQPIVENALTHGIGDDIDNGWVEIRCALLGDILEIQVRDNGRGMEPDELWQLNEYIHGEGEGGSAKFHGIALRNVHHRLRLRYGEGFGLQLENAPEQGILVRMKLGAQSDGGRQSL